MKKSLSTSFVQASLVVDHYSVVAARVPLKCPSSKSSSAKRAVIVKLRYAITATSSKVATSRCFVIQVSIFVIRSTVRLLFRITAITTDADLQQSSSADCLKKLVVRAKAQGYCLKRSIAG